MLVFNNIRSEDNAIWRYNCLLLELSNFKMVILNYYYFIFFAVLFEQSYLYNQKLNCARKGCCILANKKNDRCEIRPESEVLKQTCIKSNIFARRFAFHVMLIVCARALLHKLVKQVRDNRYIDSFNLLPAKPFALSLSLFFFF